MAYQIIQQPDGKFAVFSSVVDSFVAIDCTEADLVDVLAEESHRQIELDVARRVADLRAGKKPYAQFTLSWKQAMAEHRRHAKPDPETDEILAALGEP